MKHSISMPTKLGALLAACALSLATGTAQAQQRITFAATGGFMQTAAMDTMVKPATEKLGVQVRQETLDNIASIRVQVQSGKPAWDIVKLPAEDCAAGAKEGLFEKLDYNQIPTAGIPAGARDPYWVGANLVSTMLAWRTDKYKDNPPKTWADFWDVKKFPGRRALGAFPQEVLEIALMADGVPPEKLYPLDVDRAFKSLQKIKPSINVWWKTGNQGAQLLKDGEVDMLMIWGSRISPMIRDKSPVDFTYNEALLGYSCLAIPKGAANAATAQKVIALMLSPEIQANIPGNMDFYGPVNADAYKVKNFSPEVLRYLNSSPQNIKGQGWLNPQWWGDNMSKVHERFQALMLQ
jgi:putative spermidine/putrescine transport system substrate-binding protein